MRVGYKLIITVGQVMPETAEGGPIGFVEDGDVITIDIGARSVDADLSDGVLQERRRGLRPLEPTDEYGWLAIYQQTVQPLSQGAVLGPREWERALERS
jgi:dihydroxy-acid dehydratase